MAAPGSPVFGLPGSVLFVCSMNAIRSPMAEKLAKDIVGNRVYFQSAGVRAGTPDPFAVSVMQEQGIDMAKHRPRAFEDIEDAFFDLIITLAPEAHHKALEITRDISADVEYWPTLDPSLAQGSRSSILDAYRGLRDGLSQKIRMRFEVD